jgi:hypothetical protein
LTIQPRRICRLLNADPRELLLPRPEDVRLQACRLADFRSSVQLWSHGASITVCSTFWSVEVRVKSDGSG